MNSQNKSETAEYSESAQKSIQYLPNATVNAPLTSEYKIDEKYQDKVQVLHESDISDAYHVENTPFQIHHVKGNYWVGVGQFRVSEETFTNFDDAYADTKQITWNRIVQVIGIITDTQNKLSGN